MKNNLTIHQTDERMHHLNDILKGISFPQITHVYAPNVLIEAHTLSHVEDGSILFCGRLDGEARALANSRDITLYSFLDNEKFQAINSRLTAEGALMILLEHTIKGLDDLNTLILGFGRTGAALARVLSKLDVTFDICSNSSIRPAHAFARHILPLKEFDFTPYDVIINTVPSPLVSDKEVMTIKKGALYIDLASHSAINLDYARYLGVNADVYPALPAKCSPYSAAKAMADVILEVIK